MKPIKFIRVHFKLYLRLLRNSQKVALTSVFGVMLIMLTALFSYHVIMNSSQKSTFTKWDEFQSGYRSIASVDSAQCEFEDFDLNKLKQEVSELEKSFETGHSLEGSLYGLSLKKLPFIQAQFLADNYNLIGNQNKSYNSLNCKDALCILKSIYSGDELAANLNYYWYLKTGSVLSLSNHIPAQKEKKPGRYNEQSHEYSSYLFNQDELKKFYLLAKSLPTSFLHTPLLKSIHKVPSQRVEGTKDCSLTTNSGEILISEVCLGFSNEDFFKSIAFQISNFVDIEKGREIKKHSISSSEDWIYKSLWYEKGIFDISKKKYLSYWKSFMPKESFINSISRQSPKNQLQTLLVQYRFNPALFGQKTPEDIKNYISNTFFQNKSYDSNGLYKQYLDKVITMWSQDELKLWSDCLDEHIPQDSSVSAREIASKADSPLFRCVDKKIPSFLSSSISKIKSENYEACGFFNSGYKTSHLTKKFYSVVDKFLQEQVLKRKIELQNHGNEVLLAQHIKERFKKSIDPINYYVNCFNKDDQRKCFDQKVNRKLDNVLSKYKSKLSPYYSKLVKNDMKKLFSYNESMSKANELTKKYLAPFYSKVSFAAHNSWKYCKKQSFSKDAKVSLPLKFSGGKHFVNAKLLNCLNSQIDSQIFSIVDFTAQKTLDEQSVSFELTSSEKDFAQSFMTNRITQIYSSLLEQELTFEKEKTKEHFISSKEKIIEDFLTNESFFDEVYSFNQITTDCLEKVSEFYPSKFFYQSESQLDAQYGKGLCNTIITHPKVSQKINDKINYYWNENKSVAQDQLSESFADYSEDCKDDYPVSDKHYSSRNKRMRTICIQESFQMALDDALEEWRDDDLYEHFYQREQMLGRELASLKNAHVQKELSTN